MSKKDKVSNIFAIRKQIFKTFSWTIATKLWIDYDRIKPLNSSMFWDNEWNKNISRLVIMKVINSVAILWAIIYNFIINTMYKLK